MREASQPRARATARSGVRRHSAPPATRRQHRPQPGRASRALAPPRRAPSRRGAREQRLFTHLDVELSSPSQSTLPSRGVESTSGRSPPPPSPAAGRCNTERAAPEQTAMAWGARRRSCRESNGATPSAPSPSKMGTAHDISEPIPCLATTSAPKPAAAFLPQTRPTSENSAIVMPPRNSDSCSRQEQPAGGEARADQFAERSAN
mmetsp:Transcript_45425/g.146227  ORF Transcript_45425/g.146227 Transcript_45425/m.146227 type:complete len:205 (+) Transcript_45425:283-897(+)